MRNPLRTWDSLQDYGSHRGGLRVIEWTILAVLLLGLTSTITWTALRHGIALAMLAIGDCVTGLDCSTQGPTG